MAERAAQLVDHVLPPVPMRQWVLSLPHRLRYRLAYDHELCRSILAIYTRAILGLQRRRARQYNVTDGRCGSVTFIQRFGAGLRLNVHFHTLAFDGVFSRNHHTGALVFTPLPPPTNAEISRLLLTIVRRVVRLLTRRGLINPSDDPQTDSAPALATLQQASIRGVKALSATPGNRIARIRKPSLAARDITTDRPLHAHLDGFDLHAAVDVPAHDRPALERLCRYLARPAIAQDSLALLPDGNIRVELRKPWRDGTTHLLFEPLELIGRLAAFVPRPRINLILYHGVLAPNAKLRREVVAYRRDGERAVSAAPEASSALPSPASNLEPAAKPRYWSWADLMRRTFEIDVLCCPKCNGRMRVLATITEPRTISAILDHIERKGRAPPPRDPAATLH